MIDGDMTELQTAASAVHELFISYVEAGFTESQAMQLVCQQLSNAGNNGQ